MLFTLITIIKPFQVQAEQELELDVWFFITWGNQFTDPFAHGCLSCSSSPAATAAAPLHCCVIPLLKLFFAYQFKLVQFTYSQIHEAQLRPVSFPVPPQCRVTLPISWSFCFFAKLRYPLSLNLH